MTTKDSGAEMNVKWETTRVNFWNIAAIVGAIAVNAFTTGVIYNTMQNNDKKNSDDVAEVRGLYEMERTARVERGKQTDGNFKVLFDQMPQFQLINQQINRLTEMAATNAAAIDATNKRLERIVDITGAKLDTIIARQSDQSADIKVIQSQLSEQKATRSSFPALLRMK